VSLRAPKLPVSPTGGGRLSRLHGLTMHFTSPEQFKDATASIAGGEWASGEYEANDPDGNTLIMQPGP
jgi:hypothetical protein